MGYSAKRPSHLSQKNKQKVIEAWPLASGAQFQKQSCPESLSYPRCLFFSWWGQMPGSETIMLREPVLPSLVWPNHFDENIVKHYQPEVTKPNLKNWQYFTSKSALKKCLWAWPQATKSVTNIFVCMYVSKAFT
jgi:hypothetical protein